MRRIYIALIALSLLLSGCGTITTAVDNSSPSSTAAAVTTAPITATTATQATAAAKPLSGWVTEGKNTYYVNLDGTFYSGWLELDGKRYYLNEAGILQTGWLTLDGKQYYMQPDGAMTRGKAEIGANTYHFTSAGVYTIVVNPWNKVPADYTPDLVAVNKKHKVDRSCEKALLQMLADCEAAGYDAAICSSFREHEDQIELYNDRVARFMKDEGYSYEVAQVEAAKVVAVPGTSEHELGLAVDLVDNYNWSLDESQAEMPTQKWLMEHCWEYGFILRYPTDKTEYTGIIYEPWHYRYVGIELALELRDSGMCLEEYFASLS